MFLVVARFLCEINTEIKTKVIFESINVADDIIYNLIFSAAAGSTINLREDYAREINAR